MISSNISRTGLGCVTFGREIGEDESFRIMDHAWERGIKDFDTAAVYGGGASERIVGNWMRSRGCSPRLATKLFPPFDEVSLQDALARSFERLGIDEIDTLYLHRWDVTYEPENSMQQLDAFLQAGKVKKLGASNFTAAQLADTVELQTRYGIRTFDLVQNNHNYAVSDFTAEFRNICTENRLEIVTYSPLAAGFLTGKHRAGVAENSRFHLMPAHQEIYFNASAEKRLDSLLSVAARFGHSAVTLALAWALRQNASLVLIGGRKLDHLDQVIEAKKFDDVDALNLLDKLADQ